FSLRPPPPSSTLFPYTTLFRSSFGPRTFLPDGISTQAAIAWSLIVPSFRTPAMNCRLPKTWCAACSVCLPARQCTRETSRPSPRSEEHTSELQSRFDLVCRLLL